MPVHLATQDVEQVGGGGHVGDLHVGILVLAVQLLLGGEDARILVAELEETLHAGRGVLGTLAVVTVGKRHDKTGTLHPLGLTGSDELIDDALSVVGEITELGLPHDEAVGVSERVAILEAESTELGQGRVGDDELALVLADVLERSVDVLGLLVVEDGVALREGTTLNILTGETDVVTLSNERAEGESLSSGPVNVLTLNYRLSAVGQDTLEVAVDVEALRSGANNGTNVLESLPVNTSGVVGEDLGSQLLG